MGWYHLFILEVFIGQFGSDLEKIKSEPIDFQWLGLIWIFIFFSSNPNQTNSMKNK